MRKSYDRIYFLTILLAALLSGCFDLPDDVIMPQWNVDLNVPLTNETYILDDIIKATNYVSIDPLQDSLYIVTSDEFVHVVPVSDFVMATETSSNLNNSVGANNQTTDVFLAFPEGAKIKSAIFTEGKVKIVARNPNLLGNATLHFRFPGIKSTENPPRIFEFDMVISANSSKTEEKILKNYTYNEPANQDPYSEGKLWVQATGSSTIINPADISFDCHSSAFIFSQVTGYLKPRFIGHKEQSFKLDIGTDAIKYQGKIKLKESKLVLKGEYISSVSEPFQVRLKNITLIGKRNGQTFPLHFNNGNDSVDFTSKTFTKEFNQDNSNINSFIEFMPENVVLAADYYMNPDDSTNYKTAMSSDAVKFVANFVAKNILAIKECTTVDTLDLDIESNDRSSIEDGQHAELHLNITNNIPLDVWIKITLADENKNPLFVATSTSGNGKDTILIRAANIDNLGNVISAGATDIKITLNSDQISKFSKAHYTFLSVTVQTAGYNDNNPFKFPIKASDWIKVQTYGQITFRVKEDK